MQAIGIVAEYNPLHIGHESQLHYVRSTWPDATIIVVMSGSFVQRGTPAFFSKFDRAKWAVLAGADIVIELPGHFAVAQASHFAAGAVRLLARLGVMGICFGAECTDLSLYERLCTLAEDASFQQAIQEEMQTGCTYGVALRKVYLQRCPDAERLIQQPNSLLGLEYLKAIRQYQLPMAVSILKRHSSYHSEDLDVTAPSATAIRAHLTSTGSLDGILDSLPISIQAGVQDALTNGRYVAMRRFYDAVHWQSRLLPSSTLATLPAFTEGLQDAWKKASTASSWNDAREQLKTKRYTYARLDRMATYTLTQWDPAQLTESYAAGPQYARLLACRASATPWLKKEASIPYITKWAPFYHQATGMAAAQAQADMLLTDLQHLTFVNPAARIAGADYTTSPYVYK